MKPTFPDNGIAGSRHFAWAAAAVRILAGLSVCVLLAGCITPPFQTTTLTPSFQPENIFLLTGKLPPYVKRVAVLPLACDSGNSGLVDGRDILAPVLLAELTKTRKFETVCISPSDLRQHTGRMAWGGEEVLPRDLLPWLHQASGCDAVLFCRLTTFRGYAPLAVGWRLRLVDTSTGAILWSADDLFDAGRPSVQAGATRFRRAELQSQDAVSEDWLVLNSPSQFGQYSAATLLATLPGRE